MKNRITEWLREYAPFIAVALGIICAIAVIIWLAQRPAPTDIPENVECQVVQFDIGHDIICAIECAWSRGYGGYATSTPVDCDQPPSFVTRMVLDEPVNRTVR